jgi:Zn-dependent protease
MNTFLGLFNMIPVGLLDGHAILQYKKVLWISLFSILLGLWIFEFVFVMNNLNYWYYLFVP